jgi:hypothetical protein
MPLPISVGRWQGSWATATAYAMGDQVFYGGNSYLCRSDHTSGAITPTNAAYWDVTTSQGATGATGRTGGAWTWRGAWSSTTQYATNDAVVYNGSSWIAVQSSLNQIPTSGSLYWNMLAAAGTLQIATPTVLGGFKVGPGGSMSGTFLDTYAPDLAQVMRLVTGLAADGATDDSAVLQAAMLAAAGNYTLALPAGKVIRAQNLKIDSNVSLHIPPSTVLKLVDGSDQTLLYNRDQTGNTNVNIRIYGGGEIDGNAALVCGVAAPPVPGAPALGGAGSVPAGTWYYYATYTHSNGMSKASPVSASIVADGAHQVAVPVTASSNTRITGINLYRSAANDGTGLGLVASGTNTTGSITDTTAVAGATPTAPAAANQGQSAILFTGVTGFRVDDVYIHDGTVSCLQIQSSANGVVSRVRARRAGNDNIIIFNGCHEVRLDDCVSSESTQLYVVGNPESAGFEVGSGVNSGLYPYNITLVNCVAWGNWSCGFTVDDHNSTSTPTLSPRNVTFVGCVAYQNGAGANGAGQTNCHGFHVLHQDVTNNTSHAGITFSACVADGNVINGFKVEGQSASHDSGSMALTGCIARNSGAAGFFTTNADRVSFGTCVSETNGVGFQLATGQWHSLDGCRAYGNTGQGLLIQGTATDISVNGGQYNGNGSYGIQSQAGSDYLLVTGVHARGNTTGNISLDAGGVHNVVANNQTA